MPKLDLKIFEALGEFIAPPAAPARGPKKRAWRPTLNPTQQKLWDCKGQFILCWSEKFSGKTYGCLQVVMRHCYRNRNALGIILTVTGNMATDGGSWHKLLTEIIPQWEDGKGIKTKTGVDKQHNPFVWVLNRYNEWSMIKAISCQNPDQLWERFRGREPSIVLFDEATAGSSDEYFKAVAAQLGRRPLVEDVQQYLAATNPDDPDHWVHRTWFGLLGDGSDVGPEYVNIYFPRDENAVNVGTTYFKQLDRIYSNDETQAAWFIEGEWRPRPSGDALFRDLYQPAIHVRPLTNDGNPDPQKRLAFHPNFPMIVGLDPGSVYNAFVFQQFLPIDGKQKWAIIDEIVTMRRRISYEVLIPAVMRRMRWWMDQAGKDIPFAWISDSSAFNQFRAAGGSYDVLEIERIFEQHRARYKLKPLKVRAAPKFNGSIVARTRLGQNMLGDEQVIISSACRVVQKMFEKLECKKQNPLEPIDPDAMLTPRRSDYVHTWDAVSYVWLAASYNPTSLMPSASGEQTLISAAA